LLTELEIPFPQFGIAETALSSFCFSRCFRLSIIDPSFLCIGGQGMKIVINKQELEEHVVNLLKRFRK
jgi:carbamoyl-phosphate synthase large subunit